MSQQQQVHHVCVLRLVLVGKLSCFLELVDSISLVIITDELQNMALKCHLQVRDKRKHLQSKQRESESQSSYCETSRSEQQSKQRIGLRIEADNISGTVEELREGNTSLGNGEKSTSTHPLVNDDHLDEEHDQVQAAVAVTIMVKPRTELLNGATDYHYSPSRPEDTIMQQIMQYLQRQFGENLDNCVLKFKNSRGSHVPINMATIRICSARNPLSVEICERYSMSNSTSRNDSQSGQVPPSVTPMCSQRTQERLVTAHQVCERLHTRLCKLESAITTMPARQTALVEVRYCL